MIDSLRPVTTAPLPCEICGSASLLYGVLDFNRCCLEYLGIRLPLCGVPIYYRRCGHCGFLFTDAFDDWTTEQFKKNIYNNDYRIVDPEYQSDRPRRNAADVLKLWGQKAALRVLDYGGGNDLFCANLRAGGFAEAVTYDPMAPEYAQRPKGKFDLLTCFETLEHVPDPLRTIDNIVEYVAEPGIVYFTTLLQQPDFDQEGMNWWYVRRRNGHISIFSKQALTVAWARHGYKIGSLKDQLHFAYRTLPPYVSLPGK
jgi:hypothetical protein